MSSTIERDGGERGARREHAAGRPRTEGHGPDHRLGHHEAEEGDADELPGEEVVDGVEKNPMSRSSARATNALITPIRAAMPVNVKTRLSAVKSPSRSSGWRLPVMKWQCNQPIHR